MRTLFIGFGVLVILWGLIGIIFETGMVYLALSWFIGGLALIIAGLNRYRGEWPTFIGTLIIFFGVFVFLDGVNNYLAHTSKNLSTALFGILILLVGSLLLCSGHKLHKYSKEIELLRKYQENIDIDEAQPSS